jgi:hypothetical protein
MSIPAILLAMLLAGLGNFTMHHNDVIGGGPSGHATVHDVLGGGPVTVHGVSGGGPSGGTKPADVAGGGPVGGVTVYDVLGGGPVGSPHP